MTKRERTVGELRTEVRKSRRSNKFMAWMCGGQSIIGAFAVLATDGGWGWVWFSLGFFFTLVYVAMIVINDITLKTLEGLDDDL